MRRVAVIPAILLMYCLPALACFQTGKPQLSIHANTVTGKATLNGKPIRDAKLQLFRIEARRKKLIKEAKSNLRGEFDFGKVDIGRYELQMNSPSGETVEILVLPQAKLSADRVHLKFFADFCHAYETYS